MAGFKRVERNLQIYKTGVYYAYAKVNGKPEKKCLKTKNKTLARRLRDEAIREWNMKGSPGEDYRSWKELVRVTLAETLDPKRKGRDLKESTVKYWTQISERVEETLTGLPKVFTREMAEEWWYEYRRTYSPPRANNSLAFAQRMGEKMKGSPHGNVFKNLLRVPVPQTKLEVIDKETFQAVVTEIKKQGKAHSSASADFVEFLAYSGLRLNELQCLEVQDIRERVLIVRGGATGTKNHEERAVPIIEPLKDLLARMTLPEKGKAFYFKTYPKKALYGACDRLNIKRLSPHKLRHFFATVCVESGVDFPTLALWMGHKDGGILAAKTYSHIRDAHSEEMAARVRL